MKFFNLIFVISIAMPCFGQGVDLNKLRLPDGFSISVYAEVENPRQLALGDENTVYVGSLRGKVWSLKSSADGAAASEVSVVAEGLNTPTGVAYYDGDLYIGEINRISKISDIGARPNVPQETDTVSNSLPSRRHHGFKFLAIGPDEKIYFPVGAPCNVCEVEEYFGTLMKMNLDGEGMEIIAQGVRNTVLGLTFSRGNRMPSTFGNAVFWAEHGSWNRSQKNGYRVMVGEISESNNSIISNEPFISGWLDGQDHWGRPVDILNMPDGSLLISDDMANVVYRVVYNQ